MTATTLTAIQQSNGNTTVVAGINKRAFPQVKDFGLLRLTSAERTDGGVVGTGLASILARHDRIGVETPCDEVRLFRQEIRKKIHTSTTQL
ncbi:MAG TPA: hypothetical protein VI386_39175 [Candidatus Sulfotelmatobacter sp.]